MSLISVWNISDIYKNTATQKECQHTETSDRFPSHGSARLGSALSQNTCSTGSLARRASAFIWKCPAETLVRVAVVRNHVLTGKLHFWDLSKARDGAGWGAHMMTSSSLSSTVAEDTSSSVNNNSSAGHILPWVLFVGQLSVCVVFGLSDNSPF